MDDQAAGKTTLYTYDVGGNITLSQQYAYTTGTPGTLVSQKTYGYTDSSWKDLLTSYNGTTLTYDAIGNPLTYRDGIAMTWSGRNLATLTKSGTTTFYGYNADGKRTSKTVGSNVTKYYYDDSGRLIKAEEPGYNLWLNYNPNSSSADSISYYGVRYSFLKNAQDDVIAILDNSSNIVAQYTYDAWGNVLSITGSMASTVGAGNPIRYRSYYYDTDTGLYYLNSRYYDPTTARFVNADDSSILSVDGSLIGTNLFAYCNNNPVMNSDPTGNFRIPTWIVSTAIDVLFTVLNAAMESGYLAISGIIYTLARSPWTRKTAVNLITKKVIPVYVRGFINVGLKVFKKAALRILGITVVFGKSYISNIICSLTKGVGSRLVAFVTGMLTWGGIIAMGLDMADGKWDDYITWPPVRNS